MLSSGFANMAAGVRWRLGTRGVTSLEFALVGSLLMLLVLGSLELSRYLFTLELVRTVSAEAVRMATLRGSQNLIAGSAPCTNLSGNLSGAGARTPYLQASRLTVTMSGCTTASGITTLSISVQYPFVFAVPLFGATNRTLTETAQAVFN